MQKSCLDYDETSMKVTLSDCNETKSQKWMFDVSII